MKRKSILLALYCAFTVIVSTACGSQILKSTQSSIFGDGEIRRIKITANQSNVRLGCATNSPVLQTSPKDTKLDVITKVENWYAVRLPNNSIGFVHKSESSPVITGLPTTGTGMPGTGTTGTGGGTGTTTGGTQPKASAGTPSTSANLTSEEQEMVRLVNAARAQNNVPPLKVDSSLTNVARLKSQDMINKNYFSHTSPTYGSPFDMMRNYGIEFVSAGENIAGNQTVQQAHNALMNSPGHRANILNPNFTNVGIGIKKGGPYGMMFTQEFISKPQ